MKAVLIFLFFLIIVDTIFCQVTNIKAGLWSDQTIWSNNSVPTSTTNVTLNYDVTIDIAAACKSLNTNGHKVIVNAGVKFGVAGSTNIVFDIDGNQYNTVTIGTQVWMTQDLKVRHYRNGDPVYDGWGMCSFSSLDSAAWTSYSNPEFPGSEVLYNQYAVNEPRGLAPEGWHIPSDSEWNVLINYLGGASVAGGKMKSSYDGGTNSSGFKATLGGGQVGCDLWLSSYTDGPYWSSTPRSYFLLTLASNAISYHQGWLADGYAVRCIKD